jgi:hypothetical protein
VRFTFPDPDLPTIMAKLGWGSEQRGFSVDINPRECQFLLDYIAELELKAQPLDEDDAPTAP